MLSAANTQHRGARLGLSAWPAMYPVTSQHTGGQEMKQEQLLTLLSFVRLLSAIYQSLNVPFSNSYLLYHVSSYSRADRLDHGSDQNALAPPHSGTHWPLPSDYITSKFTIYVFWRYELRYLRSGAEAVERRFMRPAAA